MGGRRDPAEVVRLLGGQARTREIREHCTDAALRFAAASGALVRVRRGMYALPELPSPWQTAVRMGGRLSHESAALHFGWATVGPAAAVHVMVPSTAGRIAPLPGVHLHYADAEGVLGRPGVTSQIRTVLDCAATMPFTEALAIADSALRAGAMKPERLVSAARARRGRGRARMVRAADARAENPFESALRATVLQAGLTGFEPQQAITCQDRTHVVDLADHRRRLVLEADSHTFHTERAAFRRDCRRYGELFRVEWPVLKFAYEDVMFEPGWVGGLVTDVAAIRERQEKTVRTRPTAP